MKKTIKIVLIILLLLIMNCGILVNAVQAVEGEQIKIYTKGYFPRIIRNNGIIIKTAHAVYEKDGKEYPVYCLNRELHGVGEYIATYDVTDQGKITDLGLWRVIINGYPYKTIEQLGVANEGEAYMATKQSIYCYIYNTGTEGYSAIDEAGSRVINAMNKILENAKNSTESFEDQGIEILKDEKWQVDNLETQYVSKQYELKSKINISKFTVNLVNQVKGSKITNLENQEKNEFSSNEKFKILIPIINLEESGEFGVKIQTEMETKPIFFGKSPSADLQDYALTAFSYENKDIEFTQDYEKNNTKIIVEKQDEETQEPLQGAKFEVLNENRKVIRVVETDENGLIKLEQIMPGTYYIREVKTPDGYEAEYIEHKIEIKLNEEKVIKVTNRKIVIIEEPPEEPPEEPSVEEPPKEEPPKEEPPIEEIPRLPKTGM